MSANNYWVDTRSPAVQELAIQNIIDAGENKKLWPKLKTLEDLKRFSHDSREALKRLEERRKKKSFQEQLAQDYADRAMSIQRGAGKTSEEALQEEVQMLEAQLAENDEELRLERERLAQEG